MRAITKAYLWIMLVLVVATLATSFGALALGDREAAAAFGCGGGIFVVLAGMMLPVVLDAMEQQ